uniref:Thioredoxin domain-containing protein n=1 Tax=Leersia perrieri TaxID=77586 RepID=A0A0D9VHB2_9ORYZ
MITTSLPTLSLPATSSSGHRRRRSLPPTTTFPFSRTTPPLRRLLFSASASSSSTTEEGGGGSTNGSLPGLPPVTEEEEDDDEEEFCPVECVTEFKTDEEFLRILERAKATGALVVVDFFRPSCGSCKYIEKGFMKLCKGSGDDGAPVVFLKHNVIDEYDEQSEVADRLRIKENYDNLMKALQENDPSWPSLMLKLCTALKTADKLVSCANADAQQLLQKVEMLERVLERGDHAVAEIVEGLQRSNLSEDNHFSKSKPSGK